MSRASYAPASHVVAETIPARSPNKKYGIAAVTAGKEGEGKTADMVVGQGYSGAERHIFMSCSHHII
jgi:hypothetical protein